VTHQKLLQEVDDKKTIKIIEDSRRRCAQTISDLQIHFQQLHALDLILVISPSKSTISLESYGQRGEIRITGIAENGERTLKKAADFEIAFNPAEDVKYELVETPGQKGMWSLMYKLPRQRDQRCSVKYPGQDLVGSPLTICNVFQLEWETNIVPGAYEQLYRFNGSRAEKVLDVETMTIIRGKNLLPVSMEAFLQWEVNCEYNGGEFHVGVVPSNYNWDLAGYREEALMRLQFS
jgi:hypothetical protein